MIERLEGAGAEKMSRQGGGGKSKEAISGGKMSPDNKGL